MITRTLLWIAVVVSIVVLVIFTAVRLIDMGRGAPGGELFDVRYVQHRGLTLLHMLPGLVFLALAPLQFVAGIRQRHIRAHRRLGWVLVPSAALSGVLALVINVRLPAFGGVSTQAATLFFGVIFLFALAKAIRHARRREIRQHREWMIRVYALAAGVATIRFFIALLTVVSRYSFDEAFGASFWLGFSVNLLAAEVWINRTRDAATSARALRPSTPAG